MTPANEKENLAAWCHWKLLEIEREGKAWPQEAKESELYFVSSVQNLLAENARLKDALECYSFDDPGGQIAREALKGTRTLY